MPEKFIVPQFIDTEDKILGPITVRQFLLMLGATLILFVEYKIFQSQLILLIAVGLPTIVVTALFGFVKINGQPFHIFFVNFLQTQTRPPLRVWNKDLNDAELRALSKRAEEIKPPPTPTKHRPESTRLRDLALTVNTGGVYNAEEDQF